MAVLQGWDLGLAARSRLTRRGFLGWAGAAALVACTGDGGERAAPTTTSSASVTLPDDPFTLGVAPGDPLPDGVVLWTRLAPEPVAGGGLPSADVHVRWEVAADESFGEIVETGTAVAVAELGHSVHVDVRGLDSDRPYWYRFRVGGYETPVARTRTAPAAGAVPGLLRVGQVSCQAFGDGYYTAYADLAAADVDVVVHCGDYIYEQGMGPVRGEELPEPLTVEQYRDMYRLYKGDGDLQAAHRVAPWLITWDDHEVENNYQGTSPQTGSVTPTEESFLQRRAAAYQAWWEHMPVRLDPPTGPDLRIYRMVDFGDLARFSLLDTRQYRSEQVCADPDLALGDVGPRCDESFRPDFTVLGEEQEAWLAESLDTSTARWNVLVQQIVVQQWRFVPGNAAWNLDQWDGYPAARNRLLADLRTSDGANPVVLTGDVHSSWVGSLAADFDDPDAALLGTEFVGPSISSDAPAVLGEIAPAVVEQGPHVLWAEATRRGWVRHEITPDEWRADFRHVEDAAVANSSVEVATSWLVPRDGGVQPA